LTKRQYYESHGYECVFEKAGIVRGRSIEQQFNYAQAFANQPLPRGIRVAVITNAGGPGIMAADAVESQGLEFARLTQSMIDELAKKLPDAANVHNPIDVLGDAFADRYAFALDLELNDPNVDCVLVLLTPQAMTECEAKGNLFTILYRSLHATGRSQRLPPE
jgi:acyl-CoA synthetase (NDP forming)